MKQARRGFSFAVCLRAATVRERSVVTTVQPLAYGTVKKHGDTAAERWRGRSSQSYPAMSPDFFTDPYARGSYAACLRAATVQPLAQLVAGDLATGEIGSHRYALTAESVKGRGRTYFSDHTMIIRESPGPEPASAAALSLARFARPQRHRIETYYAQSTKAPARVFDYRTADRDRDHPDHHHDRRA